MASEVSSRKNSTSSAVVAPASFDLSAMRASLADAERTAQERLSALYTRKRSTQALSAAAAGAKWARERNNNNNNNSSAPFVPPKQLLLYLVRMGSFTSMPKVIPASNVDSESEEGVYPPAGAREDLDAFLGRCARQLGGLPPPIERETRVNADAAASDAKFDGGEKVRVLQWNVLSQALGTKNDNFVRCPPSSLSWRTRRFRMLEEIARHGADVVCLQEVDHFKFLRRSLAALGYEGHFFPKPDSPCLYLEDNTGPDGCAIFYKKDKFDLQKVETRVLEVWHVESNQVVLLTKLRSKLTGSEVSVACTHLKARNGALLSTLRNEQGKDILDFVGKSNSGPVIITGDFNAEPTEPVYETMTGRNNELRLSSAYATASPSGRDESSYTTWKIREDGEHKQTLDYIFHSSDSLRVDSVLEMPADDRVDEARFPSAEYASDHCSLVADFTLARV